MKHTDSNGANEGSDYSVLVRPHVVHEDFDGEVIILNLNIGLYHALNESASFIWTRIVDGHLMDEIIEGVAGKYGVSQDVAESMVASVIGEIEDVELVDIRGARPAWTARSEVVVASAALSEIWPAVETYRDMRAALVLDPIHEVDDSGWPTPGTPKPASDPE